MRNFYYNIDPRDFQKFQAFAETVAERLGDIFTEFSKSVGVASPKTADPAQVKIRIDVGEDETNIYAFVELPGIAKEDVSVTMSEDGVLTVSGVKRKLYDDRLKVVRGERAYGEFSREIPIKREVQTENISATFRDGVLTVTLPKLESARAKTVNINIQ
jgi:HSP20 family protein